MKKIIDVKTNPQMKLWLKFSDGVEGEFCFGDYFPCNTEVSKKLLNPDYFSKVSVNKEFGCIEWPDGYDPAPDVLYAIITKQKIIVNEKIVFDPALGKSAWLRD